MLRDINLIFKKKKRTITCKSRAITDWNRMEHETTVKYLLSLVPSNVSKQSSFLAIKSEPTRFTRSTRCATSIKQNGFATVFQIFKPTSLRNNRTGIYRLGNFWPEWNEFKVVTDRSRSRSGETSSFQNRQRFNSTSFRSLSSSFSQFSSRVASWINSNYRLLFRALK